jgi:hypothetical protein
LEIWIALATAKNIFSNDHTPKMLCDSAGQNAQKSRIPRIRRQQDTGVRTTAYENVLFNDVGLSTDLRDKTDFSAQPKGV